MRTLINGTARKLLLFYEDPLNGWLIEKAEKSIEKEYSPLLWHYIFLHFFYCAPSDPDNKPVTSKQPLGSNDPKWDKLFGQMQGLRAREVMLRYIRYRKYLIDLQREKAA